jgi:hypothetical protein
MANLYVVVGLSVTLPPLGKVCLAIVSLEAVMLGGGAVIFINPAPIIPPNTPLAISLANPLTLSHYNSSF